MSESNKYFRNSLVALVVAAHGLMLLLPSVNQEFVFADGARFFKIHDQGLLDQYFSYQANTLGLPWLAHVASTLLPYLEMLTVVRLLSVGGIILWVVGVLRIGRYQGEPVGTGLLALLLLNPLVWTYSGRGTADFLPAAVAIFAISIALEAYKNLVFALVSGVMLGFASILKPHVLCLSLMLFGLLWSRREGVWLWCTWLVVLFSSLGILGIYLVKVHGEFGFWVTPPRFQSVHRLSLGNIGSNFLAYTGFLVMSAVPLSLTVPGTGVIVKKYWKVLLPVVVLVILVTVVGIHDQGEMNLGPLDRFISKSALSTIFVLLCMFCVAPVLVSSGEDVLNGRIRKSVGLAMLITLLAFSFSRPAQRYLLPVLPLFILIMPREVLKKKILIFVTIIVFISVDAFIVYSQWCTGTAAMKMVRALQSEKLLNETDPGAIAGDVGNYFRTVNVADARYVVVPGRVDNSYLTVSSGPSVLGKAYSLVSIAKNEHAMKWEGNQQ